MTRFIAFISLLPCAACSDSGRSGLPGVGELGEVVDQLRLSSVTSGLTQPTFVAALPGTDLLLVLEQPGRIRKLENGELLDEPFLDLTDRIRSNDGEQGLLGLAFHPRFTENGLFYLHYSSLAVPGSGIQSGDGVISEFTRSSPGASTGDPSSERRVLHVSQPASNHNGGMLAFSPSDGFLYLGLGDGGGAGDPRGNGQDLSVLLGKMLRIDVDARDQGEYGVPEGNMTGPDVRPEIWSYGLRNPWRFSFDAETSDLYIGDVGQDNVEEVDYEPRGAVGRNYGWKALEGSSCFRPSSGCDPQGITLPVVEYNHPTGCSITGGYVYRGRAIPALRGVYLYADYCSGLIGSLRIEHQRLVGSKDITASINAEGRGAFTSFGVDADGELYLLSRGGTLFRIQAD